MLDQSEIDSPAGTCSVEPRRPLSGDVGEMFSAHGETLDHADASKAIREMMLFLISASVCARPPQKEPCFAAGSK